MPADEAARPWRLADFDFMIEKITANYAGFSTKVTEANRDSLAALTVRLRERAATAGDGDLEPILREWLAWFHDGHVNLSRIAGKPAEAAGVTPDSAAAGTTTGGQREGAGVAAPGAWTESSVKERLAALGDARDPMEGIWETNGGQYRMAVLRSDDRATAFRGVLLATTQKGWGPGEIKAELTREPSGAVTGAYRMGDHSVRSYAVRVLAGGAALAFEGLNSWIRSFPEGAPPLDLDRLVPASTMFLRRISPRTLWLRMPDFDPSRYEALRGLLADSAASLNSTDNLVIDLRNNGGGSDAVYEPLIRLLYTRPIYSIEVEMLATPDNVAALRKAAETPDLPAEIAAQARSIAELMEAHLGDFVSPQARPFSIGRCDSVLPYPRRVAVLLDGAASSGEQFLLAARQSRKVTLFGQRNSAGVLDFANVVRMPSPSGRFQLSWAISRSMRLPDDPVDPDGIAPDIRIPPEVEDPVGYAQAWLERQVD